MKIRPKPTKEIIIPVEEDIRRRLQIFKKKNKIVNFVSQLELFFDNKWKVVVRYNCYHDFVHKDIYSLTGKQKKEILGKFKNLKEAIELSTKDLRINYNEYIEKFKSGKL